MSRTKNENRSQTKKISRTKKEN